MNVVVNTSPLVALDRIQRYFALGCEVKGLGRGHMKRLKKSVKKA
jgi:UDP-N-acetyl-D-glucosamine dehydrogenase